MGAKKPRQARVYLNEENESILKNLATVLQDLSESQIVTVLLSASLRSVKENGYKMPLPLRFKVLEDLEECRRLDAPAKRK